MVSCRHVYHLASRYLDRELGWWTRLRVRAHLRACDACRQYLDQLRRTVALLRGRPLPGADAATEARLLARLHPAAGAAPAGGAGERDDRGGAGDNADAGSTG